jgi:hypothetical protein
MQQKPVEERHTLQINYQYSIDLLLYKKWEPTFDGSHFYIY